MPLDSGQFTEALRSATRHSDRVSLIEQEILDRPPVAFEGAPAVFQDVRAHLARTLRAEEDSVVLVGSGACGFSIAPPNFTRAFQPGSDLDFAVISPRLFDEVWDTLLEWGHPVRHSRDPAVNEWFGKRQGEMFWGWLDPETLKVDGVSRPHLIVHLRELRQRWFSTFRELGTVFPGTEVARRDVSARLYRSRMHLLHYQANGLRTVHQRLLKEK